MLDIKFLIAGICLIWLMIFWITFYFKIIDPWVRKTIGIRNQIQIVWHRTGRLDDKNFIRCSNRYCWAYKIYKPNTAWLELKMFFLFIFSVLLGISIPLILTVFLPSILIIQEYGLNDSNEYLAWQFMLSALLSIIVVIALRKKFFSWGGLFRLLEPHK